MPPMIRLRVLPDPVVFDAGPGSLRELVPAGGSPMANECPQRAANAATATPRAPATPHRTPGSFITCGRASAPQIQLTNAKTAIVTSPATDHLTMRLTFTPK